MYRTVLRIPSVLFCEAVFETTTRVHVESCCLVVDRPDSVVHVPRARAQLRNAECSHCGKRQHDAWPAPLRLPNVITLLPNSLSNCVCGFLVPLFIVDAFVYVFLDGVVQMRL